MAQTKAIVDALPGNGDVVVAYVPDSSEDEDEDYYDYGPKPAAKQTIRGDWVFQGGVEKDTADVSLRSHGTADAGRPLPFSGYVRRASDDVKVAIYAWEAGKSEPAKPTLKVTAHSSGSTATFGAVLSGSRHNVLVTAEVGTLSDDTLPGADQVIIKVRAKTKLSVVRSGSHLRLTARVTPADTSGTVQFQRLLHGRWLSAGSAKLKAGVARVDASGGAKVRARFTGGSLNAASAWSTVTVK
jgi:hypothetical protein